MVLKWIDSSSVYLGDFVADEGIYELDLEILSDTSCLNPGHPRLVVSTDKAEYFDQTTPIFLASAFGVALGMSWVVLGIIAFSGEISVHETRIFDSENVGQYFQRTQNLSLGRQFSLPPAFALLAVPCLLFVIMALMVMFQPYPSKGLYVRLLKPGHSPLSESPL